MDTGQILYLCRSQLKWSRHKLSIESDISESTIREIETGTRKSPQVDTFERLLEAMGYELEVLSTVPGNQLIKADAGKPRVSLVPPEIIYNIATIREYGNNKYPEGGKDNWKEVEPERYIDAAYRHLLKFIENPTGVDEESGYPHLWHLACNIAFLCELFKGSLIPKEK